MAGGDTGEVRRNISSRLSRGRVLVVGDLILDRHVWGDVSRVSPEAPVQVLDVHREDSFPGGAANVACKVAELGGEAVLAGLVGRDHAGEELREATRAFGVDCSAVIEDASRPTTRKMRYVARGQQLLRVDSEDRAFASGKAESDLADAVARAMGGCEAVIIEDYGKGSLTRRVLGTVERRADGLPRVVDPNGREWGRYREASVLTPNLKELAVAARRPVGTDAELEAAARDMLAESDAGAIAVTRGPDGISLVTRNGVEHVPTAPAEVYDVTGAGDAVTAVFALALAGGMPLRGAAEVANLAGAVIVRQMGVGRISREMLLTAYEGSGGPAARKVVSLAEAVRETRRLKSAGAKVVFTNGCFDILHPGHVHLLETARACGEALVVGLNSDESIRRIKGPGRPAQNESRRAQVLAALASVTFVVVFDEDTPRRLIRRMCPDVLVKGGDYSEEEVVGAKFVRSYGGEVVRPPLTDHGGTSDIIARIKTAAVSAAPERVAWCDR